MDYIHELRKLVGNRPLIMVGAALLVINQQGQVLLIKRTDNKCWGIPGGSMELGESLEETVKRETQEEIGGDVKDMELFGVYSGPKLHYQYPNGAEVYNVSVVYLTQLDNIEVKLDYAEHSDYQFFDIQNLPGEISPPVKPVLQDLAQKAQSL